MNTLSKLLLTLTAAAALSFAQPAHAFTITMEQMGTNVVATGSGAFNLTGLTLQGPPPGLQAGVVASAGIIQTGPPLSSTEDRYTGFTGPTSFGSGGVFAANTGSGAFVGMRATGSLLGLFVPHGYVSGNALMDSMTFNSASFASLGVTPGTYVWHWGTGLPNENFTLIIGAVPDGGSTVSLLGCALLGLAALRRFVMG